MQIVPLTLTPAEFDKLTSEQQSHAVTSVVGRDVLAEEVETLLHALTYGKTWLPRMWAALALGRARPFADRVLAAATAVLEQAAPGDGSERVVQTLVRTVAIVATSAEPVVRLAAVYRDGRFALDTRSAAGIAIATFLATPENRIPDADARAFCGSDPAEGESASGAVLRTLLTEAIHDGVIAAAADAMSKRSKAEFDASRSILAELRSARSHSPSIVAATGAALTKLGAS